jgi:hypothetical protein
VHACRSDAHQFIVDNIRYPVKYAAFVIMLCFNVFGDLCATIARFGT